MLSLFLILNIKLVVNVRILYISLFAGYKVVTVGNTYKNGSQ